MPSYLVSSVVMALIAPWMLLVSFLKARSDRYRQWVMTLFFAVFGSITVLGTGDGYIHQLTVEHVYAHMSWADFADDLWRMLTLRLTDSGARDVYKHVLSFVCGSVLDAPRLFFPIVAGVYGYFFAGSVMLVLRHLRPSKTNYVVLSFVGVFLLVKGLDGFYTVRTWTGLWILVYACLKYYESRRIRYLVLMFVPPLVHVGYFLMTIPAWIVLVLGNRTMLYAGIFAASTVTNFLPVEDVTTAISQTEVGQMEVKAYKETEERVALDQYAVLSRQRNFYDAYTRARLHRWAPTVLIFILLLSGIYLARMTRYQRTIFSIGLLTMAFSNLIWFLYAAHNRSLYVAVVFLLAGFLMARLDPATKHHFVGLPPYYRWGLHVCLLLFLPWMLTNISVTLDRFSVFTFGMPVIVWWDPDLNLNLKSFLRLLVG